MPGMRLGTVRYGGHENGQGLLVVRFEANSVSYSGVGEIRTHGTVSRSAVFKTAAFNHSATTPGA